MATASVDSLLQSLIAGWDYREDYSPPNPRAGRTVASLTRAEKAGLLIGRSTGLQTPEQVERAIDTGVLDYTPAPKDGGLLSFSDGFGPLLLIGGIAAGAAALTPALGGAVAAAEVPVAVSAPLLDAATAEAIASGWEGAVAASANQGAALALETVTPALETVDWNALGQAWENAVAESAGQGAELAAQSAALPRPPVSLLDRLLNAGQSRAEASLLSRALGSLVAPAGASVVGAVAPRPVSYAGAPAGASLIPPGAAGALLVVALGAGALYLILR